MLWSGQWIKVHPTRTSIELKAKELEPKPTRFQPLAEALVASCLEVGLFDASSLSKKAEELGSAFGESAAGIGREIVARAWMDPTFKRLLLEDARSALVQVGLDTAYQFSSPAVDSTCKMSGSATSTAAKAKAKTTTTLLVIEQTPEVHNLVVCTLCSCWPSKLLGNPPPWYKSAAYRARAVREPRSVLNEFGIKLEKGIEVRVHDSTADLRYLVLPRRPPGTEELGVKELAALVTRDSMIGTGVL